MPPSPFAPPLDAPTRSGVRLLLCLVATALSGRTTSAQESDGVPAHDPVIIEEEGTYYLFSTGRGIPIRRSRDLVRWEEVGRVFEALPPWAVEAVPAVRGSLWAPDISRVDGRYLLYYSVSSFGSQQSAIGLATNTTLDPASPEYRWVDQGPVVVSTPGVSSFNAIDPNLVLDGDGGAWLSWGSFWGGIKMRRVERESGLLSGRDSTLYSLAARGDTTATRVTSSQAIEAPFIVRRGEFYYLFASFDLCCRGARSSYNIRVGRSGAVTGPYLDERGVAMTEGGGRVLLAGSGSIRGPGHNGVLVQGDRYLLVHHFYDAGDGGRSKLQLRLLDWTEDGWPLAGDPLSIP